jgi:hypothetical protein
VLQTMAQCSKLQRRLRKSHVGATMCEIASYCQHKMRRANTAKDKPETTMTRFFIAGIAALFLATGTARAQSPEKCSCVGNACNNACMSEAEPDVVAALRKRFLDCEDSEITVFDERQLPPRSGRSPYTVAFSTKNSNMACDLWRNPIRLRNCRERHA